MVERHAWLEAMVGKELVTLGSDGKQSIVPTTSLEGKHVGLYFSAHWCPPCRAFTPALIQLHKKLNAEGTPFEIVFVSSDKVEAEYNEYFGEMPWTAIPFAKPQISRALMSRHSIMGIPALLIYSPSGHRVTSSGVQAVRKDPSGENFPWPDTYGEGDAASLPTWAVVALFSLFCYLVKIYVLPAVQELLHR